MRVITKLDVRWTTLIYKKKRTNNLWQCRGFSIALNHYLYPKNVPKSYKRRFFKSTILSWKLFFILILDKDSYLKYQNLILNAIDFSSKMCKIRQIFLEENAMPKEPLNLALLTDRSTRAKSLPCE